MEPSFGIRLLNLFKESVELSSTEIAAVLDINLSSVEKGLFDFMQNGWVQARVSGETLFYSLVKERLREINYFINMYSRSRMEKDISRLENILKARFSTEEPANFSS
ncbi:ArsR family transcriptional regulator [bacterium]|jgi:transcription initiation factor IIE alpha subunit|nr:ArsR family transcriptional regulator [bacterium]